MVGMIKMFANVYAEFVRNEFTLQEIDRSIRPKLEKRILSLLISQ